MNTSPLAHLQKQLRSLHPRTRRLHLNSLTSLVSKSGSMLVSVWLVPLTMHYLTPATYGTWVTISAMSTLLTFLDLGIGNGLRNQLTQVVARPDPALARQLVSTAYALFGVLQAAFVASLLLLARYVPWAQVLNSSLDMHHLRRVVLIVAVAMAFKLVLDLLSSVLLALQAAGWVNFINFLSNGLVGLGTYGLSRFSPPRLEYLALVVAGSPLLVLGITSGLLYGRRLAAYRPSLAHIRFQQAGRLLSLGYAFFVIQLAYLVVFYTDNLLINHFFGPTAVAAYTTAFRYFSLASTLFGLVMVPYWSAFTQAFTQGDVAWMRQTHRLMYRLWAGLVGLVVLMVVLAQPVYHAWVGEAIQIPLGVSISLGVLVVVTGWNLIASTIINSAGKLRLQLSYALGGLLTNIPLAFLLAKTLGMGSAGVVMASVVSLSWGAVLGPLQARRLINGTARGIWGR